MYLIWLTPFAEDTGFLLPPTGIFDFFVKEEALHAAQGEKWPQFYPDVNRESCNNGSLVK